MINRVKIGPVFILLLVAVQTSGNDPDSRPASFFGTVTVDGNPIHDGTLVTAAIGGTEFAVATTFTDASDSVYRLDVPGDDPTTPAVEGGAAGQTVTFLIEGVEAPETAGWGDGIHFQLDVTGAAGADLAIVKDDSVTVASPGQTLTYSLTVTNEGPVDWPPVRWTSAGRWCVRCGCGCPKTWGRRWRS